MIHMLSFILSRTLGLNEESREKLHTLLSYSGKPSSYPAHTTSRLATRELKFLIRQLRDRLMKKVLKLVDGLLRSHEKISPWGPEITWATLFCVVVLFSMLLEESQISFDIFTQTEIDPDLGRIDSRAFIEISNQKFYEYFKQAFHLRYYTNEPNMQNNGCFNPFQSDVQSPVQLCQASQCLISTIKKLKTKYSKFFDLRYIAPF